MKKITLATCSLNQFALDFTGNYDRIKASFRLAKEQGATFRLGPELEITGYGCCDHYLEMDTITHAWEVLAKLLQDDETQGILGDVGMPLLHNGVRYNCRVFIWNGSILLIRPKKYLANDGNYREMRWFAPWAKDRQVEDFYLPPQITRLPLGQTVVPIGDGVIKTDGVTIGTELCEELFTPGAPHTALSLAGVEVFTNGSASHHEFRKLQRRVELITEATLKCGGVYLYANQQGCDGERVYYDGCCMIIVNGQVVAQGSQFSLDDVEVLCATVDIDQVTAFRASIVSRSLQASQAPQFPTALCPATLCQAKGRLTPPRPVSLLSPNEEIRYGPACWLWDYLRRSKQSGFFLPLSGGIDSCSTALVVYSMCELVYNKVVVLKDRQVLADLRAVVGNPEFMPASPQQICGLLFHTGYMGTQNSSSETKDRASRLASAIGSYHVDIGIDAIVSAILAVFTLVTMQTPQFKVHGGTVAENLALQNIQARTRMVVAYLFAQLLLWVRGRTGSLLVLGSSNVDETLRGYLTKYDCSSADLNPIGGISKVDLQSFIDYYSQQGDFGWIKEFLTAPPTAELEPRTDSYIQIDEVDMGMTYAELSTFGTLRKMDKLGPVSMFESLLNLWGTMLNPREIADKVKRFFFYYGINRHKTTVLPPSYHMSAYSPDSNRFDLRPFLYSSWSWQFSAIDKKASEAEADPSSKV
ncbi:glutamine-dependent NAD(+) synthetase [Kappamyces sp. JEL0829]|nr:glutamine-dependent NAD(+) synthetase [Kappamyces sp. JEL0829]